mmetsp:Transcript_84685/g.193118  ORF Transcript_84685/g.193118 Transcript_84685/m.193118 type:complete len:107 (-) Transcript_84685:247-567(-)
MDALQIIKNRYIWRFQSMEFGDLSRTKIRGILICLYQLVQDTRQDPDDMFPFLLLLWCIFHFTEAGTAFTSRGDIVQSIIPLLPAAIEVCRFLNGFCSPKMAGTDK